MHIETINYILDENKRVIPVTDLIEFMEWFQDFDKRVVAQNIIGGVLLSTVFLGIDHGFGFSDVPILFETMIFDLDSEGVVARGETIARYETWEQAENGHDTALSVIIRRMRTNAMIRAGDIIDSG